jgi:prepilin signal peptidase PulO-like enzyme (type II secretory pathway)
MQALSIAWNWSVTSLLWEAWWSMSLSHCPLCHMVVMTLLAYALYSFVCFFIICLPYSQSVLFMGAELSPVLITRFLLESRSNASTL